MSQSSFGKKFVVTTWGESHGKAIGAVLDGCPAGLSLCEEDIQVFLDRRKPGQSRYTTARKEGDLVEILSGVFEGKTTGTPISLLIRNTDQRSRDYGNIAYSYRPGHADFTFDQKYGFRDYRGGGRSSGRETAGRVAAGAIAIKLLNELGITSSGLDKLVTASYHLLGLISFLTAGEDECRAWTIKAGTKAPQAAGKIHTDFERGFIRAEVVNYKDLLENGSLAAAREKGVVGLEGKDYVVKDGDVILFRFNV